MTFAVRLLENLFRHKFLVLFPIFLVPILVVPVAMVLTPVYYEAWTSIWVDRPQYLQTSQVQTWQTPAQLETDKMNELLKTGAFMNDIAGRTVLAPLVGSANGEARIQAYVQSNLTIFDNGSNLVSIRMRAETPQLAFQILNGMVEAYKARSANDQLQQTNLAVSFYQQRLSNAQDSLTQSTANLRRYIAANPKLGGEFSGIDPASAVASAAVDAKALATIDPQLGVLQQQVQSDQTDVAQAQQSLNAAQLQTSAALQGQDIGLQVLDPARMPTQAFRDAKKRGLVAGGASLVGGLLLSVILLTMLMMGDRSLRSEVELERVTNVPYLGSLPRMSVRRTRTTRRAGPNLTRRAIGFVAGTALPPPALGRAS